MLLNSGLKNKNFLFFSLTFQKSRFKRTMAMTPIHMKEDGT
jgi:hypothetical protein